MPPAAPPAVQAQPHAVSSTRHQRVRAAPRPAQVDPRVHWRQPPHRSTMSRFGVAGPAVTPGRARSPTRAPAAPARATFPTRVASSRARYSRRPRQRPAVLRPPAPRQIARRHRPGAPHTLRDRAGAPPPTRAVAVRRAECRPPPQQVAPPPVRACPRAGAPRRQSLTRAVRSPPRVSFPPTPNASGPRRVMRLRQSRAHRIRPADW